MCDLKCLRCEKYAFGYPCTPEELKALRMSQEKQATWELRELYRRVVKSANRTRKIWLPEAVVDAAEQNHIDIGEALEHLYKRRRDAFEG